MAVIIVAGGALVLGQDQDQRGEGFNPVESFVGSISRLNIWDRVLTPQQVSVAVVAVELHYFTYYIINYLLFTVDQGAGQQLSNFSCRPQRERPCLAGLPRRRGGPSKSEPQQHFLCRYEKIKL